MDITVSERSVIVIVQIDALEFDELVYWLRLCVRVDPVMTPGLM